MKSVLSASTLSLHKKNVKGESVFASVSLSRFVVYSFKGTVQLQKRWRTAVPIGVARAVPYVGFAFILPVTIYFLESFLLYLTTQDGMCVKARPHQR